jgi:hypothetical protein
MWYSTIPQEEQQWLKMIYMYKIKKAELQIYVIMYFYHS